MSSAANRANVEDVYELSPLQQGFLFHHLRAPAAGDYVEQMTFTLEGPLDRAAFARAWQAVVDRHPALRSSFQWEGLEQPLQVVHRTAAVAIEELDWNAPSEAERTQQWQTLLAADRARGFVVERAPLLRVTLIACGPQRWRVLWTHSHLLLDGWSLPLVLRDVLAAYGAAARGALAASGFSNAAPKYRDFVAWVRRRDQAQAAKFWQAELAGFSEPTPLPVRANEFHLIDEKEGERAGEVAVRFAKEETTVLQAWCAARAVTLNTVLTAAWALVLARMTGHDDVVFGVTVSGRPPELARAEEVVGLFINTLPQRVQIRAGECVGDWLARLQARLAAARVHEHTPLIDVQGWSEIPAGRSLFETLFVFENYPGAGEAAGALPGGLRLLDARSLERTHYPLTVVAAVDTGELVVRFLPEGGRVTRSQAHDLGERLRIALGQLAASEGETPVERLDLLRTWERAKLAAWAHGDRRETAPTSWWEHFAGQVRRRPEAAALIRSGGAAITYQQLDTRSAALAAQLRAAGVRRGEVVGVCCERGEPWPIAALAVLRARAAFLPLDPAYPPARREFMLADSGARVVVATPATRGRFAPGVRIVEFGKELASPGVAESGGAKPVAVAPHPDDDAAAPAYVIYTSGSTGRPKGVVVSWGAWANLVAFQRETLRLAPGDRVLQFASTSFDASIWELSLALSSGAALVLAGADELRPGEPLTETLAREAVTCALLPPSTVAHLSADAGATLRWLIVGGEACRPGLAARWATGGRRFVNAYGPTENAVVSTWIELAASETETPIGRPLPGTRAYVLDTAGRLVPPGVAGELCVAGTSLATGYLGRAELTAERFVPDPYGGEPGARMYRTGDRVRWRPDGRLEFLGRIDQQVKLRGFRIELGEIESVLAEHPAVRDAAVDVRGGQNDGRLVAWVVRQTDDATEGSEASLRAWLAERLPAHMVPGSWVYVPALPMTPNGKVDRAALPESDGLNGPADRGMRPAGSPVADWVAGTMAEVLGRTRLGAEENFFDAGGHSLLATKLLGRLREQGAAGLALREIFEAPTPRELAVRIAALRGGTVTPPIVARPAGSVAPASLGQQRFWLLEKLTPGASGNLIQFAVRLHGPLERVRLENAFVQLVRRHEPLRIRLVERGGELVQEPVESQGLWVQDAPRDDWQAALAADAAALRDLGAGVLWRAWLARNGEGEHVLAFTFHHAIFDGWSQWVLVRDLGAAYAAREKGEGRKEKEAAGAEMGNGRWEMGVGVPAPHGVSHGSDFGTGVGYGDFAAWQRARAESELAAQVRAVAEEIRGVGTLELPTDHPRPAVQAFRGALALDVVPEPTTRILRGLGRQEGATLFMVLLAAWETWLWRHTGQTDFAVGTPVAGRTRPELEELIGLFVNTLVLRADVAPELTFPELLRRVRERTLRAYDRQEAPFERVVEAVNPERALSRTPLFQVMFAVQNLPRGAVDAGALRVSPVETEVTTAKFDLTLFVVEQPDGSLGLSLEYNRDLFEAATAGRFLARYNALLAAIAAKPKERVRAFEWMPAAEAALLRAWSVGPKVTYPATGWVHALPDQQPADRLALVGPAGEQVRYGEFCARAERIAGALRALGVGPDVLVGVSLDRSIEMVLALHAVLRAGGAYVPLDPTYPAERIKWMVEDTQAPVIVTTRALAARLPPTPARLLLVDEPLPEPVAAMARIDGDHPCYVIFTSGSTGRPKGTLNTHAGLHNRMHWMQATYPLSRDDVVLQKTTYSFDVSVWELFGPTMFGATLVVPEPGAHRDSARLAALIRQHGVTVVHFVPSMLRAWLDVPGVEQCTTVRRMICSGEALPRDLADLFFQKLPNAELLNLYGPAEAAIEATGQLCRPGESGSPGIGGPIPNLEAWVFDGDLRPVPVGVRGEIHLAGIGLARGYQGRPDLTADRWVPHPTLAGARMYKTGDLARWRGDGTIETLGRADLQIKLRGQRIELGEIETALRGHPSVRDAVVDVRGAGSQARLVGYVVKMADGGAEKSPGRGWEGELRAWCAKRLPEYMVPGAWVEVAEMPLSPNGKADRKRLPEPLPAAHDVPTAVTFENATEEFVALLIRELLEIPMVRRDDSFFELGGHSLLATQLASRVREQLQVELPLLRFFETPTVAGCARVLAEVEPATGSVEKLARARLRLRGMSAEEKARLLAAR